MVKVVVDNPSCFGDLGAGEGEVCCLEEFVHQDLHVCGIILHVPGVVHGTLVCSVTKVDTWQF